jgi:sec-independent protein translocase protein TatA
MTTIASLLNLGGPDLIIIMGIVLLLFGAKKLPELARGMGQAVREFSKAKDEFSNEINRPPAPTPTVQIEQPKSPATEDPHDQQAQDHHTTSSRV